MKKIRSVMLPQDKRKKSLRANRITLSDVAREAGVDMSTVSRIINGHTSFYPEQTCLKVKEAATRLNYRPNAVARGMATGMSRMVGVTVPGTEYCGRIVEGINLALIDSGHLMLHAWNPEHFVSPGNLLQRKIIHEFVERQVDGVILRVGSEEFEYTYFEEIWQRGIPMIVVDREMATFKTDFVGSDDLAIGAAAALHLLKLGHRKLLFIGEKEFVSTSRLREQGFRGVVSEAADAACRKIGLDIDAPAAVEKLIRLLSGGDYPTGVFCYSDRMARIFYEATRKLGLEIPTDISVLGCGNLSWGAVLTPVLSTFDQHPEEVGRTAVDLYLKRVAENGKDRLAPCSIRVAADLLVRGSTGPASTKG